MTDRNLLARACDQRVEHRPDDTGFELTIPDKGHSPSWRRSGSRGRGEITFRAEIENGVPVLVVRIVEMYEPLHERPETRESLFEVIGSSAIETFEALRAVFDEAKPPRGGI